MVMEHSRFEIFLRMDGVPVDWVCGGINKGLELLLIIYINSEWSIRLINLISLELATKKLLPDPRSLAASPLLKGSIKPGTSVLMMANI